jgi:hypothetical protein
MTPAVDARCQLTGPIVILAPFTTSPSSLASQINERTSATGRGDSPLRAADSA